VLCIAARAQTARRPTSQGADSDMRSINFGTRSFSETLSKTPFNTNTSAPKPWMIVNVNKIIPITTDDATTCCQRNGSDVLFA
jgi:hypothetical protein